MKFNFTSEEISHIKNIIFDFGGVLLNIDYNRTVEGFRSLGMKNPETAFTRETQSPIFKEYEIGAVESNGFITKLRDELPLADIDDQVNNAWCALLGDLPEQRLKMLIKLRENNYRLFLLSNTNEIHQLQFEERLNELYGKDVFINQFEEIYYSHKLGMRKPDPKIFKWVMKENNLKLHETLFIDDTPEHIEAANELGMNTHLITEGEEIAEVLKGFL